jgi:rubrerythrin
MDHLRTAVLSTQKAEDGKFFWVEFTPQFHAHLIKCAVALVPHPLHKVKQVMFMYLLELLNGEGPQSFFDLTKGQWLATQAQKEKQWLAQRRNHALRQEHQKVAEEAKEGQQQWHCKSCGCKFTSYKAAKRHQCPISKGASGLSGLEKGKGKADNLSQLNKPMPTRLPALVLRWLAFFALVENKIK